MHHKVYGKKLSRNTNQRKSLIRNLMKSLIVHGKIKTTKAKAQAIRSEVERLITKAKKGTEAMRRDIISALADRKLVDQFVEMSKTQFSARNSGYTRIIKLGARGSDASEMVLLSFVDEKVVTEVIAPEKKETKKSAPAKKTETKEKKEVKKTSPAKKK